MSEYMQYWFQDNWPVIVIGLLVVGFMAILWVGFSVFLESIGNDVDDFVKSSGLRKQHDLFREGKSSDFQRAAKAKKQADDAESDGMTTGLVTGIAIGSTINSSSSR